jgi:hypothetical protein
MNRYPVRVRASRDEPLSRWLWLVKWLLLIPHYIVLAGLAVAFVVMTLVGYVCVLVTGRYPHGIFSFNVGVLRWGWRVGYYGYEALGTDRYPPFTLADVPGYPAGLHIDHPARIPRWLPLVAWLFAIPHLLIVGALTGVASYQFQLTATTTISVPMGLVSVGVLVVGFALLFTERYPRGLYDLLVGVARWSLRVVAYVALLTPRYPPFRLDQGGTEPDDQPDGAVAIAHPSQAVQPAPVPASSGGVAGRIVALVAGVLLLFPAIGLGLGGVGVLVLNGARDANGYVTGPLHNVSTPTAAVTAEGVDIQAGDVWSRSVTDIGTVRVTASSPTGDPLFIGIAPESDVDTWLAGTAHDQLTDLYGGGQPRYQRADGAVRDIGTPAEQTFWVASAGGTGTVTFDWRPTSGRYAVVLANADGTRGVTGNVSAATKVPGLGALGIGLLAGGAAVLVAAFLLIYLGAVGLGRRHAVPPSPTPAPLPQQPTVVTEEATRR